MKVSGLLLIAILCASCSASPGNRVLVILGGDVLLDRTPGEVIANHGPDPVFGPLGPILSAADIVYANLECPVADRARVLNPDKPPGLGFRAKPEVLPALLQSGIGAVSLANNHTGDLGQAGILETLELLDSYGIGHAGAGRNVQAAMAPLITVVRGWRIAFFAFCSPAPGVLAAGINSPGIAVPRVDEACAAIAAIRARGKADFVVVSVHTGVEFKPWATVQDIGDARRMVDAGADLVFCHHPHVLQEIERHGNGIICHSLGNLVFDMPQAPTRDTAVIAVILEKGRAPVVHPVPLHVAEGSIAPAIATGTTLRRIMKILGTSWRP